MERSNLQNDGRRDSDRDQEDKYSTKNRFWHAFVSWHIVAIDGCRILRTGFSSGGSCGCGSGRRRASRKTGPIGRRGRRFKILQSPFNVGDFLTDPHETNAFEEMCDWK